MPRTDPDAEGIHLLWTWPDVLPLPTGGYDIQRLPAGEDKITDCENIDRTLIEYLTRRGEYAALLGPLRMRTGTFAPIVDPSLYPPGGAALFTDAEATALGTRMRDLLAGSAVRPSAAAGDYDVFIQELTRPVEQASVQITGKLAVAMALSQGKVVRVASASTLPGTLMLQAPSIDTIVVYVAGPELVRICVYLRLTDVKPGSPDPWDQAPYLVKGLTLPIVEADPALTTPALEYAAASGRLLAGESLTQSEFTRLAATMRAAVARTSLGRAGERLVLARADDTQGYEELPLEVQLGGLAIHPKLRRLLGFGYRDDKDLVPDQVYRYRITGRFRAEDLTDAIYDVHRVPSSTVLPAASSIRDLGLRFQLPVPVVLDPTPSATGLNDTSRRGIRIDTTDYDSSWLLPSLGPWSALVEFPRPVTSAVLEVAPGHHFRYAAGVPWTGAFTSPAPLPAGPVVPLTFASPVTQLQLSGTGTLFAVRLPSGQTGVVALHAYTGPVTYAPAPLPAAPPMFTAYNLQQPQAVLTGPIDESTPVPLRPPAGFRLNWLPPVTGGLAVWPPDLDAGPPLDAIAYQIQHRQVTPPAGAGPWGPIGGGDNLTVGSRDDSPPADSLDYGCDLDAVFPAIRPRSPGAGFALHLSDVFGVADPVTGTALRPAQPFGSSHQYEIASMDAVGRVSSGATLSNVVRLEKHIPPPLPAGPQPPPPITDGKLSGPLGPVARAIVAGDPGLTAADVALLGAHENAILLQWGWRQSERDLDPETAEFRVYSTMPPDVVEAVITSVASAAPDWQVTMTTNLPLAADELAGQWITSNGYPFQVTHNDAGTAPGLLLKMSAVQPTARPAPGPVTFGRPLAPAHQRPDGWDQRVEVYPLTAAGNYQHVFYDVLNLSVSRPRDSLWVGVSAADAQSYVPDQRTTGTLANRPGNESAVVACAVTTRYRGQPVFSLPPPLGDVPVIVTDEPTGRSVIVSLDLAALTGGALHAGSACVLERCAADDILSRASVAGGQVVLARPDGSGQDVITFPNPADEAAVVATLDSDRPQALANRYLMFLAGRSADPSAFFARLSDDILTGGPVDDRLAPKPGRYLYLARAADALGHISSGYAILPVIVRVPSTVGAATPVKRGLSAADASVTLTVAVTGADPDTTTALLYAAFHPPGTNTPGEAELLRLPNRPGQQPRLLLPDGTVLAPALVKNLADPDVTLEPDGTRVAALTVPAASGSWADLWCYGLTGDGQPSYPCGPLGIGVHP